MRKALAILSAILMILPALVPAYAAVPEVIATGPVSVKINEEFNIVVTADTKSSETWATIMIIYPTDSSMYQTKQSDTVVCQQTFCSTAFKISEPASGNYQYTIEARTMNDDIYVRTVTVPVTNPVTLSFSNQNPKANEQFQVTVRATSADKNIAKIELYGPGTSNPSSQICLNSNDVCSGTFTVSSSNAGSATYEAKAWKVGLTEVVGAESRSITIQEAPQQTAGSQAIVPKIDSIAAPATANANSEFEVRVSASTTDSRGMATITLVYPTYSNVYVNSVKQIDTATCSGSTCNAVFKITETNPRSNPGYEYTIEARGMNDEIRVQSFSVNVVTPGAAQPAGQPGQPSSQQPGTPPGTPPGSPDSDQGGSPDSGSGSGRSSGGGGGGGSSNVVIKVVDSSNKALKVDKICVGSVCKKNVDAFRTSIGKGTRELRIEKVGYESHQETLDITKKGIDKTIKLYKIGEKAGSEGGETHRITIKVLDNGEPVEGASVVVLETGLSARFTNSNGEVTFRLRDGCYDIRAEKGELRQFERICVPQQDDLTIDLSGADVAKGFPLALLLGITIVAIIIVALIVLFKMGYFPASNGSRRGIEEGALGAEERFPNRVPVIESHPDEMR